MVESILSLEAIVTFRSVEKEVRGVASLLREVEKREECMSRRTSLYITTQWIYN